MDIEILLALQDLRASLGSGFESAVAGLSESIMMVGLVLCTFVYWSVNKKTGQFALMCFSVGNTLNQFVKNIACVYRPWILDSRIAPASGALGGATGYSFPSGHTVMSGTTFGSIAWRVRRKLPVVAVVLVVIVLLEAFLRMFLGVHTPQDVLAALAESLLVVLLGSFAYDRYEVRCEKTGRNRDGLVLLGVVSTLLASLSEQLGDFVLAYFVPEQSRLYPILLYFGVVAFSEEGFKYLLLKRQTWQSPHFNCLFDGVVYATFVSLGFALWENIGYVLRFGLATAVARAITAVPGHACFGVFMGVWYGVAKRKELAGELSAARWSRFFAVLVPALLHGLYDYIATQQTEELTGAFLGFVALLFLVAYVLAVRTARQDRYMDTTREPRF